MKKLLIALTLMLALLAGVAAAENTGLEAGVYQGWEKEYEHIIPVPVGHFKYIILKDGTAEIVDYTGSDAELIIPAKVNGIPVTSLGDSSLNHNFLLTTVVIPDGVKFIGGYAFVTDPYLTNIIIPETVTSINVQSFAFCKALSSITIPNGVTVIPENAFGDCHMLTDITIPEGVTTIGFGAFVNCHSLTRIIIPENTTLIDKSAFKGCDNLTSVTIPRNTTEIGENAFANCPKLTLSVYPGSVAEQYAKDNAIPYVYVEGWTCEACHNYTDAYSCNECGAKRPGF